MTVAETMSLNGVLLDVDSLYPQDLELTALLEISGVNWRIYPSSTPEQIAGRIDGADIVLTNKAPLSAHIIRGAQRLKYIGVLATGMNVVDLDAARTRSIAVTNITDYGTPAVVQHTFALILALTSQLANYCAAARDGRWSASAQFCLLDFPVRELHGLTLGIIGYGILGRAVADLGKAFGMEIVAAEVPGWQSMPANVRRLPLHNFLATVDVVSIHCPLTDSTRKLIGAAELALMKPDALLINCARGGIVDEGELAAALKNNVIAGAGLDVLSEEPPQPTNPLLCPDIPNLILTPHCAWGTQQSRQRLVNQACHHLREWLGSNTPASGVK